MVTMAEKQRNAAITANLRHMVNFEAKDNVVPAPKTTITRGFEKVAFPKMVRNGQMAVILFSLPSPKALYISARQ